MKSILPFLTLGLATATSAQVVFQIMRFGQGSDCNDNEPTGATFDVAEPHCLDMGEADYDVAINFITLGTDAVTPPVYACPDSSCGSGCVKLWDEGVANYRTDCRDVSNGQFILVEGISN